MRTLLACCLLLALPACAGSTGWEELEPGLALGRFPACKPSTLGDSVITVVRVDPSRFELRALAASDTESKRSRTVADWAREHGLVVAANAGMYHPDRLRHVGYMVADGHVNNSKPVPSYKSVLAFGPKRKGIPEFLLADLDRTDMETLERDYRTRIQNLRMISHRRANVWAPSEKRWSTVALGVDGSGNLLFLFTRSPYSVHDLNECLLRLPIDLARAQYLEGGPEAALRVASGGMDLTLVGSFESALQLDDTNLLSWPVPNVVGVVRKETSGAPPAPAVPDR